MRSGFSEKSGSRQSLRGATAVRPLTFREVALREFYRATQSGNKCPCPLRVHLTSAVAPV